MSARALALILLAGVLSGCAGGDGGGGNPNLLAPKLVVQQRPDGNVTVFAHGAFREQLYEWMSISVDNESLTNRTWAYSLEEVVNGTGFFVEVEAGTEDARYLVQARIDVNETAERVRVAFLEDAEWAEARVFGLPFEHILDRPREADA